MSYGKSQYNILCGAAPSTARRDLMAASLWPHIAAGAAALSLQCTVYLNLVDFAVASSYISHIMQSSMSDALKHLIKK
jgi:hypothetical protein